MHLSCFFSINVASVATLLQFRACLCVDLAHWTGTWFSIIPENIDSDPENLWPSGVPERRVEQVLNKDG